MGMKSGVLKGNLGFLLLYLISKNQLSGKGLVNEICKRKGSRLSAGTIYPGLELLRKKGLVQIVRKVDKEKMYDLTSEGRKELADARESFRKMFQDVLRDD